MRRPHTAALSMLLSFAGLPAGHAVAQQDGQPAAQPQQQAATYAGHKVVQVVPETGDRLARVLELSHHIWSERIGRGPIDVQVDAEAFEALNAEGFEFTVLVDDVAGLVAQERAAIEAIAQQAGQQQARGGDAIDFTNYYPLADLLAFVNQLAAERPDLVSLETIGQSVQGRDIITMTITAPGDASDRPQVALNSLIHAREWITAPSTLRLARDLVRGYGTDPRLTNLLDQVQFVVTPVVNPDGYAYSWSNERFWRKNRRNNGDGTFGVDLNRNWDINFGGNGADPFTNSDIYHGPGPFSEPETAVMRDKLTSLTDLRAHVDTHSYSQLILWSPGFVGQVVPRQAELQALGTDLAQTILDTNGAAYTPQRAIDLYEASGTFSDWSGDALDILSFTFELRPAGGAGINGFAPSPSLILPTAQEINAAYLHLAEATALPLRFILPDIASLQFDQPVSYDFSVLPGDSDPSSAVSVFVRQGSGSFVETPAQSLGNDRYRVTIDPTLCGEDVEIYVSALTSTSDAVTYPASGASLPIAIPVVNQTEVFSDGFTTDLGWAVSNDANLTDGAWERGTPAGAGDRNDPAADFDGDGFAYLTDNVAGNSDVDSGATTLTSPALDASTGDATLSYAAWYSNTSSEDVLEVEVSGDNGATWQPADTVTNASAWQQRTIDVASLVGQPSQFRVRFIAADGDPQSIVEAGIDAVRLLIDEACPTADCAADVNGDGSLSPADFNAWVLAFNAGDPGCDQNGDGQCNPADFNAWVVNFNAGC
ncbi:MAG: M14 family zinc carboxypeptidase [Planctomycetota bacterium]